MRSGGRLETALFLRPPRSATRSECLQSFPVGRRIVGSLRNAPRNASALHPIVCPTGTGQQDHVLLYTNAPLMMNYTVVMVWLGLYLRCNRMPERFIAG